MIRRILLVTIAALLSNSALGAPIVSGEKALPGESAPDIAGDPEVEGEFAAFRLAIHEGRFSDAEKRARSLLQRFPGQVDATLALAEALKQQKKQKEASDLLRSLAAAHPKVARPWYALIGDAISRSKLVEGIEVCRDAKGNLPNETGFSLIEINLLYRTSKTEEADELLEKLLQQRDVEPSIWLSFAISLKKYGFEAPAKTVLTSLQGCEDLETRRKAAAELQSLSSNS